MSLDTPRKPQESKVMKVVNLAGTVVMLNLLFLVACLPVVTIGPALSGLYSGVRYMIRGDGPVRGFWEGFKTHFVRMLIAGLIFTGITAYFVIIINAAHETWLETGVFRDMILHAVPAMVVMMLLAALVPLNIYLRYSVLDWLRNGVNLIVKAPLWVLLSACLLAFPIACVFWFSDIAVLGVVCFVGFWFAIAAFVSTLMLKNALIDRLAEHREEQPELYEDEMPVPDEEDTEDDA